MRWRYRRSEGRGGRENERESLFEEEVSGGGGGGGE